MATSVHVLSLTAWHCETQKDRHHNGPTSSPVEGEDLYCVETNTGACLSVGKLDLLHRSDTWVDCNLGSRSCCGAGVGRIDKNSNCRAGYWLECTDASHRWMVWISYGRNGEFQMYSIRRSPSQNPNAPEIRWGTILGLLENADALSSLETCVGLVAGLR